MRQEREIVLTASLLTRFWKRVRKTDNCWLWQGGTNALGYGRVGIGARGTGMAYAHRVSYIVANGPIAKGIQVLHACDQPSCVRPEHLFLGTQLDNMRDMDAKGRRVSKPLLTYCGRGHPMTPENIYLAKPRRGGRVGDRICRECRKIHKKAFRLRKALAA